MKVRWHTRQKHEFLGELFNVWTQHVGKKPGVGTPSLEIVDLFAGFGWCRADRGDEPGVDETPWPGTAIRAARTLANYSRPKRLVVNCFDSDHPDDLTGQDCLARSLQGELGSNPSFPLNQLSADATSAAREASRLVDPKYPSIWILDPYSARGIPWTLVESIVELKGEYQDKRGRRVVRRPEIVVTLMTEGLQRNVDKSPDSISSTLGMPESEWRPLLDEFLSQGANTRQAIVYLYAEKLRGYYKQIPVAVEVPGSGGNIVYVLVYCSSSDAGTYMGHVWAKPRFSQWQREIWRPLAKRIDKNKRMKREEGNAAPLQRGLEEFDRG
jgi:three-Cys-motif partner protein